MPRGLFARSLRDVETLAEIVYGRGYITREELAEIRELLDHVGRMLTSLLKRLGARPPSLRFRFAIP